MLLSNYRNALHCLSPIRVQEFNGILLISATLGRPTISFFRVKTLERVSQAGFIVKLFLHCVVDLNNTNGLSLVHI